MKRNAEKSRIAYNKLASGYDSSREGRYTRFHIKELSDTIDLHSGDVVLDVGCGTGTLLRALSKKAAIQANGIDISERMIQAAKTRCPAINFQVSPCCPLAWEDESVDIITVCCAFHHFDHPREFIRECGRTVKKSGSVYIADPYFGAVLRFLANTLWFPLSKSGDVRIYSQKELEALFRQSGFDAVWIYRKGTGLFLKAQKRR